MTRCRLLISVAQMRARFCWCSVGVVLVSAGSVCAQVSVGSQSGRPSERITGTLSGTLGGLSGLASPLPQRNANSVATLPDPPSLGGFRSRGRAAPGGFQGGGGLRSTGTSLLGRRYPNLLQNGFGGRGPRGPSLPPFSVDKPMMLLRQTEASDAAAPQSGSNVVVNPLLASSTTRPTAEAEMGVDKSQVHRDDLARDYIAGRRNSYIKEGWARFHAGEYRQACDIFALAEAVTLGDPKARTEVELAVLHASLASGQYSLAVNALKYLLRNDRGTGDIRDADFLSQMGDVESFYGTKTDYAEHVRRVEQLSIVNPNDSASKALRAFVLWGKKDYVNAMFYAKQLVGPTIVEPWPKLLTVMERARARVSGSNSAGSTSRPAPISVSPIPSRVMIE